MEKISYRQENGSLFIKGEEFIMSLTPVREDIICCKYAKEEGKEIESLIVEKEKLCPVESSVEKEGSKVALRTKKLKALVDDTTGELSFYDGKSGRLLLREGKKELEKINVMRYSTGEEEPVIERVRTVDGERNFIKNLKETVDHFAYKGRMHFHWQETEGIYGLGQGEEGIYNYRGHTQYLYQHNMRIPMPMFFSDNGYGMLFDCCSLMTFREDAGESCLFFDTIPQLEYYFIAGDSPDKAVDGFRYLTGKASMLPKWAFGYIQSKEQYYTAEELAAVVEKYRELQVPIDCVVQDWNTWEPGNWGEKIVDKKRYGNLKECMDHIHRNHAHAMVSVWPNMNTGGENHTEFLKAGFLLNDLATYNAFSKEARKMYWQQAKRELFDGGFDSWWCDSTEPFSGPDWSGEMKREPWERYMLVGGEHKRYLPPEQANAFALVHAKGIYENQRAETEEMRVLNLTRSGYASGQKYAAVLWSGDICATYDTMKKQIVEGLNMGLSGYPYWTLDIGGFFTVGREWKNRGCGCNQDPSPKWFWQGDYEEGIKDKGYRELYVRWLEMGTFLPMFRSHGTDTPREIWNFGQKGDVYYDAIEKFIKLRYRLMPYIYSLAGEVCQKNGTMMRSLLFDFLEDERARKVTDEFMFGKSLLICPVTEPMYYDAGNKKLDREKKRDCYLPAGTIWQDFWTGRKYEGGQSRKADAPIDRIPVFVRAGAIIPMREGLSYAQEENGTPLKLSIFTGADGEFTLYEDEGNNYRYEEGYYSKIPFRWEEREQQLTIGTRKGSFEGMKQEQQIEIFVDGEWKKSVAYRGTEIKAL